MNEKYNIEIHTVCNDYHIITRRIKNYVREYVVNDLELKRIIAVIQEARKLTISIFWCISQTCLKTGKIIYSFLSDYTEKLLIKIENKKSKLCFT